MSHSLASSTISSGKKQSNVFNSFVPLAQLLDLLARHGIFLCPKQSLLLSDAVVGRTRRKYKLSSLDLVQ